MKEKVSVPPYKEFSSRVSTGVDPTIRIHKKISQDVLGNMGIAQRWQYCKDNTGKTN